MTATPAPSAAEQAVIDRFGIFAEERVGDPGALMTEAGRRYWRDAEFSSRVKLAVQVAERGQPDDGFDRFHKDSVIAGAAVAFHLIDVGILSLTEPPR